MVTCWSNLGLTNICNGHKKIKKIRKENSAHIVFLCHILTTLVDKQGLYIFRQNIHVSIAISKTMLYELEVEKKGFWICNMENSKASPMFHFGVTKKDPVLVFHFHVLNMFKCWSKLGLTDIWNEHKNSKQIKKRKNLRT